MGALGSGFSAHTVRTAGYLASRSETVCETNPRSFIPASSSRVASPRSSGAPVTGSSALTSSPVASCSSMNPPVCSAPIARLATSTASALSQSRDQAVQITTSSPIARKARNWGMVWAP